MSNEMKDSKQHILTQLYDLPKGWRKTIILDLVDELIDLLGSNVKDFEIVQCKEKFGKLRMYWAWKDKLFVDSDQELCDKVDAVINKYEVISAKTCANCGMPSTHITKGWVLPVCDSCDDKLDK